MPTVEVWLGGVVTVTVLPVVPLGSVHICPAAAVQVLMSSAVAVLLPGSVRHSPEFGLTSSPLDSWVQFWATVPLQGYHLTAVPGAVPAAFTSRQPPWTCSVLSVYGDHSWPALPLHALTNIGLPSVFSEFWLVRHSPLMPVTLPFPVGVAVGVVLPPSSYTATYATLIDAPDVVADVGVVQLQMPLG